MSRPAALPILLTIAVLSIATAALFIKLSNDAAPIVIAAARLTLSTAVLFPIALYQRGGGAVRISRAHVGRILLAGFLLAAHFFFWITSLSHTSIVSSVVLVTTNPIFVGIASYFIFKERISHGMKAGIVLAIAGGIMIGLADTAEPAGEPGASTMKADVNRSMNPEQKTDSPDPAAGGAEAGFFSGPLFGDFMSLCGAITASGYFLVGRSVRREIDTMAYILPAYGTAAILLLAGSAVTVMVTGESITGYRSSTYLYFVLLAVLPQLVGHSIFNWALKYMSATVIAVCILGEPIGAAILSWLFLNEKISGLQALGGGVILLGIFLSARGQNQATTTANDAAG